jgi:hypothetical protein
MFKLGTRNGTKNKRAAHTSKSSKKRVRSCPELHGTGQQTETAPLGMRYLPPANHHEEWHDEGGDLLTQTQRGLAYSQKRKWMLRTIELPTQTPIASSILSFIAMHTEVTSSPAFACKSCQVKLSEVKWVTHDYGEKHKTDKCLRYIEPVCRLLDRRDH